MGSKKPIRRPVQPSAELLSRQPVVKLYDVAQAVGESGRIAVDLVREGGATVRVEIFPESTTLAEVMKNAQAKLRETIAAGQTVS